MKSALTIAIGILIAVAMIMYIYLNGQRSRPAPGDMLGVLSGFRDRMCACTTPACRDEVGKAMTAWTQGLAGAAPDPAAVTRFNEISNQMTACMTGTGGAAPPAAR